MAERKYQMVRVRAGDYLLVGNDARTLYRFSTYEEYGDGEWWDDKAHEWRKIVGTFWQANRYRRGTAQDALLDWGLLEWGDDRWECVAFQAGTRKQAIEWSGALS